MHHILLYSDSLSCGIIPNTRKRLEFEQRWPDVAEIELNANHRNARIIEDCLNGRRTVWDDPFKPGRNGLVGLAQRIEIHSPLAPKFAGGENTCVGLADALRETAHALDCHFFDAGSATPTSRVDGIHLDADQHLLLGKALAGVIGELLPDNQHD